MSSGPIAICGCPGSGTSLVAKILRHAGLFTGADSGPADARKYHESQCFMHYNIEFLTRTIDFPHAPKSFKQFTDHNQRMLEQLDELTEMVDRHQLRSEYWGECDPLDQPWGWKDPRNSATALIWKQIFPQLRVVAVARNWRWRDRWKLGGSDSGNWYRKQSTAELRKMYQHPIGIEQESILTVDVDQLTTDAEVFGQVLAWCKLDGEPKNRFDDFLLNVGVER
jgi:hypothetical protein